MHEQVTSPLFGEYAWFQRVIGIHIRLYFYFMHGMGKKIYLSLTLNTIPPHAGLFKRSRFVDFFVIINSYSATIKADMHCSHKILKTLGKLFERWGRSSLIFEFYIFLNMKNGVFYRKSPLVLRSNFGWVMSRRLSQLKLLLTHPDFLPSRYQFRCHARKYFVLEKETKRGPDMTWIRSWQCAQPLFQQH